MMIRTTLIASTFAAVLMTAAPAGAETFVTLNVGPPAPVYEVVPPPRHGYVWAPGYWDYQHHKHYWRKGHWEHERHGHHWVDGRWAENNGRWELKRGHWERD